MSDLPERGTFKVQTVGPPKTIPNKKDPNKPWKSWSLQFEGDVNWYDTFWLEKDDPVVGQEMAGTKSYDEKWNTYKFELERQGGKANWNPAGAQATVMLAAVELVNGFLAIPGNYEKWQKDDKELKKEFDKYILTAQVVSGRIKDMVVGMGAMQAEQKTAGKRATPPPRDDGDPGPAAPPPGEEDWVTGEEEEVEV